MKCLVVVAHPDDEIIWMGGVILRHPGWDWSIFSLCRAGDPDRAPRFSRVATEIGATVSMSDLDDSPDLAPLSADLEEIRERIATSVSGNHDLIFTHGPNGEYTRHLRHEQVHAAVREMSSSGDLPGEVICFAYTDCNKTCTPKPSPDADILVQLTATELAGKRRIVHEIYGFGLDSFEYNACGPVESFRVCSAGSSAAQLAALIGNPGH